MINVSVILVTFNSEKTLQRTLDSVIGQNGRGEFFNLELIVVDDCSSDKTQQILHQNNISFSTTETNSGGPNKGRNMALKQAGGDYICFIDHDDVWMPDKIIMQLRAVHYAPVITTGYSVHHRSGSKTSTRVLSDNDPVLFKENETFLAKLRKDKRAQNTYLSTLMIRNDLKNVFFEEHFGMCDYDWLLRIFENQRTVEIPKVLMKRYVSGDNLSLREDYRKKDFYYILYTFENYEDKYPREVKLGRRRSHGSRARYFYLIDKMKNARAYFLKGPLEMKAIAFYITSFAGSALIRKSFRFFG